MKGNIEAWRHFSLRWASSDEQARAAKYHQPADAVRHLLGRALLRLMLLKGGSGGPLPSTFPVNPWGKPELPGSGFYFSITHAGDAVWLAISSDAPVGIDVEAAAACSDPHGLAAVFHPKERAAIDALQGDDARLAFLRCWVRKEAVVKALGQGLSCPLDSFQVATGLGATDWLRQAPQGSPPAWTCIDLPVAAAYHLSLAAMAPGLASTCQLLKEPNSIVLAV